MYYWNRPKEKTIKNILLNINEIKSIFISIEFCSLYGVGILEEIILKNKIQKDAVVIIFVDSRYNLS